MSLLSPLALLGAALVGPLIVAMYLLKLRREDRPVGSTFLWRQMVRDVEANAPWQKLRRNLLLLLQLLLMLLLVFALARPFFATQGISGSNLIIILDRSASMAAVDVLPNRLAAAQDQALRLIDQMPDGGRATIIAAGGPLEVPAAASSDRRELRRAVEAIQLHNGGSADLSQALNLASALAAREADSEVAIISDGNITLPEDLRVPARVSYFPIGSSGENLAISAMALLPGLREQTLFVQVRNYGTQAAERRIDIFLDDSSFNAYNLVIDPGGEESLTFPVPSTAQVVEARLAGSDVLPADDRAFAVSTMGSSTTVRLMSDGNRFLEVGLALLSGLEVQQVPASTTVFTAPVAQVPVTILDGVVPDPLPPGNLFFIGPPRSTSYFSVTGEIEFPSVRPVGGEEHLLRNVSLSEASVLKAARLVPASWARPLVESDSTPLLIAGEREGRRIVVLAFNLHNSDLPLLPAFPLLLANLMEYLAPGIGGEASQLVPGQVLALQVDAQVSEIRITRPDGQVVSSRNEAVQIQDNQALYADTTALGVYTIEQFNADTLLSRRLFAVNLFAPSASYVLPQPDLRIAQISGAQSTIGQERDARQELWRWIALLALVVLVIEWLVYQRPLLGKLRAGAEIPHPPSR
ncbi:MAG: VWA domain-containing protein [Candidatus Viridilinea halotolerans]|uniref:VWA domain-containing protein n=1 Tax=Candidatus Viridilinea halotolerans TaxID=2491704 RepID=A0A426U527_9CHLR|nr:MAG: VWA domain-containing protein [Candidatus Viridilinea halotolerans]